MAPKLTPEMRSALSQHPGQPIEVEDDQTHRVYLLVDREDARSQLDAWIIQQLIVAEADIEAGRVSTWDKQRLLDQLDRSSSHAS